MKNYKFFLVFAVLMLLPSIQSCTPGTFIRLGSNVKELEVTYAILGKVSGEIKNTKNVRIFIKENNGNPQSEIKYMGLLGGNKYVFTVKPDTNYLLFAYEDRNANKAYEPGEPVDLQEVKTNIISLKGTDKGFRIKLKLLTNNKKSLNIDSVNHALIRSRPVAPILHYGEIININDVKFSRTFGEKGLWAPMDFINEVGIGVYFLESYKPNKIPILFVTGAGGYPQSWQRLLNKLDRSRYQPWFYYYASGDRLERSENILNEIITTLHNKYKFHSMYVTAHSMGGLVARGFIMKNVYQDNNDYIKAFVSISTPWSGHEDAAKGVRRLPVSVPSWRDMQTNSQYIQKIFRNSIADKTDYYLFASYKGDKKRYSEYNDGVVSVASQLRLDAQDDAKKVIALEEDHVDILSSNDMISRYNRILNSMIQNKARQ